MSGKKLISSFTSDIDFRACDKTFTFYISEYFDNSSCVYLFYMSCFIPVYKHVFSYLSDQMEKGIIQGSGSMQVLEAIVTADFLLKEHGTV